jgi:glutathione S-transferase
MSYLMCLPPTADYSEGTKDHLMPSGPLTRARVRRFIDRFTSSIIVHLNPIYIRDEVSRIPTLLEGIRHIQDSLPQSGPFFLEDHFSVADIAVAPFIGRMYTLAKAGLIPDVFNTITGDVTYKRFDDYAQALFRRPSFQSTYVDEKVRK